MSLQESFKAMEREAKIKSFSAAGLSRADMDPALLAKIRCADWLNDAVSRLETQTEQLEADLEALAPVAGTGRGTSKAASSSAGSQKASQLATQIEMHQEYISKCERTLRLLENDQVTAEEVDNAIKDSLEYFIEAHAEGICDDFIEDEEMWELLPLEAVDEGVGKITAHKAPSGMLGKGEERTISAEGEVTMTAAPGSPAVPAVVEETEEEVEKRYGAPSESAASTAISGVSSGSSHGGALPRTAPAAAPQAGGMEARVYPGSPIATKDMHQQPPISFLAAASSGAGGAALAGRSQQSSSAQLITLGQLPPPPPAHAAGAMGIQGATASPGSPGVQYAPQARQPAAAAAGPPPPGWAQGPQLQRPGSQPAGGPRPKPPSPGFAARPGATGPDLNVIVPTQPQHQALTLQQQQAPPGFSHLHPPQSSGYPSMPSSPDSLHIHTVPYASAAHSIDSHMGSASPFASAAATAAAAAAIIGFGAESTSTAESQVQSREYAEEQEPLLQGSHSKTSGELFTSRSPFAARASSAFSPQGSTDGVPGAGEVYPEGYGTEQQHYKQHQQQQGHPMPYGASGGAAFPNLQYKNGQQQQQQLLLLDPALIAMNSSTWFTGGWVAAADALNGGAALAAGGPRFPWWPNPIELALIDAGAAQRTMVDDAEWRTMDGTTTSSSVSRWKAPHPTATPLSFPTTPHPTLSHESLYASLPQDTLFFSFYFHQGSMQQLFAANALKRQGWRYHKNLKVWFARTGQPKVATEHYEEGSMAFWDPTLRVVENPARPGQTGYAGWGPGRTSDRFRFEYSLLENENTNVAIG